MIGQAGPSQTVRLFPGSTYKGDTVDARAFFGAAAADGADDRVNRVGRTFGLGRVKGGDLDRVLFAHQTVAQGIAKTAICCDACKDKGGKPKLAKAAAAGLAIELRHSRLQCPTLHVWHSNVGISRRLSGIAKTIYVTLTLLPGLSRTGCLNKVTG